MKTIIIAVLIGLFVSFGLYIFIANMNIDNTEIDLRTSVEAQEKKIENYYDKMWKILKQKAGVTEQYKDSFKEIYVPLIEGRYSKGDGSLMKWVTESNPTFDPSLYKDLMQSIEIERTGFYTEQNVLIDLQREHKNLLRKAPSGWFIDSDILPIEIKIITSALTKDVVATGEDNDVDLFAKDTIK